MDKIRAIFKTIRNWRLQTILILTYVILITVPLIVFSISYFQLSKEKIMEIAQKDVYTIVKKNNEIIDAKLSRVQEMIYSFKEDPDFYEVYSNVDPENKLNVLQADTEIAAILNQYFSQSRDIYSVEVVAPYFTFGTDSSSNSQHGKNFVPPGVFMDTRLYATAQRGQGQIQWVPTYNFSEMFHVDYLEDAVYDYEYLFSAVGIINGSYYNGTYTLFDRQQKSRFCWSILKKVFSAPFMKKAPS